MTWITLVTAALQSVRAIAGNAELAKSLGLGKHSQLIDSLLGSAISIIGRGEGAYDDLKAWKLKVDGIRDRVEAGERIPVDELDSIKAESDSLHEQMQALKP